MTELRRRIAPSYSYAHVIYALQSVSDMLGHSPRRGEWESAGYVPCSTTVRKVLGESTWNKVLFCAGLSEGKKGKHQ